MGSQPLIDSLPPWPPPCSTQAAIVWGGERINALLALHWERFSTQNYFDPKGLFFSAVVSGPLIGLLVVILVRSASEVGISAFFVRLSLLKLLSFRIPVQVNVLVLASSLLIKVKRAEFRKHGVMERQFKRGGSSEAARDPAAPITTPVTSTKLPTRRKGAAAG